MAFRIDCTLAGYEFRALRSGISSKSGQPWYTLVLESPSCDQVEVSVPADKQGEVLNLGLSKGEHLDCQVLANAGKDYSYLRLLSVVHVYDAQGELVR